MSAPEIGSLWRAGDGRRMVVMAVTHTPHAAGGGWAQLEVLPPLVPRQRRKTQMAFAEFGKFLTHEASR